MPIFEVQGPDGATYEIDAPDQNSALSALGIAAPAPAGRKPQHFEFDGSGIPGYDPKSGMVESGHAANSLMDEVGAFSGSALDGVPVAGPMLLDGVQRLAAATNPFSDKPYEQELYESRQAMSRARRDNPIASMAGSVTGATAATLPLVAAAPAAFGVGQATRIGQIGGAALGGGGLGGADAAVRSGGDVGETAIGAFQGAGAAGLGTYAAPLVSKGVQTVGDALLNNRLAKGLGMDKQAFNFLRTAAGQDALEQGVSHDRLSSLGPDAMLLDIGPNLRSQAQGLASMPGEGNRIIRNAIGARDADANWRIRSTLDDTLGPSPIPSQVSGRIERNMQAVQPQYREAFREAMPADTSTIAKYLDSEIVNVRGEAQRGLQKIRGMLDQVGGQPGALEGNPAVLLETRKAVDGMLETVKDSNARNAFQAARQAIDDALADAAPLVKDADASYAELARQREALQRGQTVLASGREAPRPSELAQEFRQGALPQGRQIGPSAVPLRMREGARAEIERIVGTNANDRVALQRLIKGEGDWNRARLSTMFGKEKTERILDLLERERLFAETSHAVTKNSETAARRAAQEALGGSGPEAFGMPQAYMAGGLPAVARTTAYKGVERVVEALRNVKSDGVRGQLATALTGNNSAVIDALMASRNGAVVPSREIDRVARALLLTSVGGVGR